MGGVRRRALQRGGAVLRAISREVIGAPFPSLAVGKQRLPPQPLKAGGSQCLSCCQGNRQLCLPSDRGYRGSRTQRQT